jgi:NAD(P)-dependent dehydrogenase (short-subunit alcohol dehydrogenase family)
VKGVALITGAGSGLGRQTARLFASRGMGVALLGRREGPLAQTAEGCEHALVLPTDVREPEQVRAAVRAVEARWGRLDVVVNAAALLGRPEDQSVDVWRYFECVLRTNVLGPALVTEEAVRLLRPGGVVVHVGSSVAAVPTPDALAYGASKAALEHLVGSHAVRFQSRRVRVVGFAPGGLHGPPRGGQSPMEAAAEVIAFLVSRHGAHIHGTTLRMDDGEVPRGFGPGPGGARSSR